MTEAEKEAREAAAEYIHKKRPEWHDRGVGIVQGSHYRKGFEDGAAWQASRAPQPTEDEPSDDAMFWEVEDLRELAKRAREKKQRVCISPDAAERLAGWIEGFRRAPAEPAEVEVTEAMVERAVEFHYPLLMTGTQAEYERRYDNYGEGVRAIHQAQAKADVRAALRAAFATRGTDDE